MMYICVAVLYLQKKMDLMQVFIKEEVSQDDDLLISSTLPASPGSHGGTFDRWVSSSLYLCGNFGVFFHLMRYLAYY
jgi:hypothetical protein